MSHILIAEDDPVALAVTEAALKNWGYQTQSAQDGESAWQVLNTSPRPSIMIVDWKMPGLDGTDLCQKIRQSEALKSIYIIMLTSSSGRENMVAGLNSGADDYLEKPLDAMVLKARIGVAQRIVSLQDELTRKLSELQEAMDNVRELRGLLPICAYCKNIRNDDNYWEKLESYLGHHTHAQFSHSICPSCYETVVNEELQTFKNKQQDNET